MTKEDILDTLEEAWAKQDAIIGKFTNDAARDGWDHYDTELAELDGIAQGHRRVLERLIISFRNNKLNVDELVMDYYYNTDYVRP
jgi:hypothetical protein